MFHSHNAQKDHRTNVTQNVTFIFVGQVTPVGSPHVDHVFTTLPSVLGATAKIGKGGWQYPVKDQYWEELQTNLIAIKYVQTVHKNHNN